MGFGEKGNRGFQGKCEQGSKLKRTGEQGKVGEQGTQKSENIELAEQGNKAFYYRGKKEHVPL